MKRLLIMLCLLVFGWFLMGFFIHFGLSKWQLNKQAQVLINKPSNSHQYKTFRFSRFEMESLVWLKHKEFKYKEDHYDVVGISWDQIDSVRIVCYKDTPETKFFNRMARLISKKSDTDKRSSSSPIWSNLLKTPLLSNQSASFELVTLVDSKEINFYTYKERSYQAYLTLDTPPPQSRV
jgi:hypothetical protein